MIPTSEPPPSRWHVPVLVVVTMLVLWPVTGPLGGASAATAGDGLSATTTPTDGGGGGSSPAAVFAAFPVGGPVGEPVRVAAVTSADIETYEIDWGDGTTETIPTEGSHAYDSTGTYDVTLTVTDGAGRTDSVTRTLTIDDASDRRVIAVDESRSGTVDDDDPTTTGGRHYEPVRFEGSAGQLVAVATDTEAPVGLSVRRADDGTVVRSSGAPTRHPAHQRVELPADGEYVVRVVAERDGALPVGYELAVSELAVEPGNESAPPTADLGPGPVAPGTTVESALGRDDRRDRFGSIAEATSVTAVAGDRLSVEYASPRDVSSLLIVRGPGFQAFPNPGETLRLPGNGTYSIAVSGPNPRLSDATFPVPYTLTVDRTRQSSADRLVVDADGAVGNYTSIEAATDAAAPGTTVEVRPGTYREQVTVDTNLTLVAPSGATLEGDGSGTGIAVETPASEGRATVEGLTITGFETGVDTAGFGAGAQDWRLRNVTVAGNAEFGVRAASGDWRIEDTTIARNGRIGVDALLTDGNRTIRNSRIAGNDEGGIRGGSTNGTWTVTDSRIDGNGFGLGALNSPANWTVQNVTLTDSGGDGILAQRSTGTWTVAESRVAGSGEDGIDALNATADWQVRDSQITNNGGDGITAFNTSGDWTVAESRVAGSGENGVFAVESAGTWAVANTTVSGSGREGIDAQRAAADWTLADAVVENNTFGAVNARGAAGDWVVRDTVVAGSPGLTAAGSDGDWTVTRSTVDGAVRVSDAGGDWTVRRAALTTVAPIRATGVWTVRESNLRARRGAVDAREAAVEVDARGNWWGQASGPTDEQCLGNVDCGAPLSDPASAGSTLFAGGNGTADDPYQVATVGQLQRIGEFPGANFTLVRDIDASGAPALNNGRGFEPIGTDSQPFTGTFDGDGHTISNLRVDRSSSGIGLFGTSTGTIRNVTLVRATTDGESRVGALVGRNEGTVAESASVAGTVGGNVGEIGGLVGSNAGSVRDSHATGTVTGSLTVGGLIGSNSGTVADSYATSDVAFSGGPTPGAVGNFVGGLAGVNFGNITSSAATGDVTAKEEVGGLVGVNVGPVTASYATGDVTGTARVGGLIGEDDDRSDTPDSVVVSSFAVGTVTGDSEVGGLVGNAVAGTVRNSYWDITATGQSTSDTGTGLTTAEMTGQAARENMSGLDFTDTWVVPGPEEYPRLQAIDRASGGVSFAVLPERPVVNTSVQLDATVSGANESITAYEWTFGDGTTGTGAVVNHTYDQTGEFTVELAVTVDDGTTRTVSDSVIVTASDTLVVDADGAAGNFTAIEPAVENASDTARVVVRPGEYRETVDVAKNVTVVAPDGATLRKPATGPGGFDLDAGSGAAPTIRGFTVRNASTAVDAVNTDGAWSVADLRAVDAREVVDATRSTGDWSVSGVELLRDSRFRSPVTAGVTARDATGDWAVRDSRFVSVGRGVGAADTRGDWRVENVSVRDAAFGVDAGGASGTWTVSESRIAGADLSVSAFGTASDWTIRDTRVTDSGRVAAGDNDVDWRIENVTLEGTTGIDAGGTGGDWVVDDVTVTDGPEVALQARQSTGDWAVTDTTLTGHDEGVDVVGSDGNWTVRNTTVRNVGGDGVDADDTTGEWLLRNVTVTSGDGRALAAQRSTGDWAVRTSSLVDHATGLDATASEGDWTVRNTTVRNNDGIGIDATGATGDWRLREAVVRANGGDAAVSAAETSGNWSVRTSYVLDSRVNVDATGTTGDWTVHRSNLRRADATSVDATGASPAGNARRNYWVDASTRCRGTVDCGNPLAEFPRIEVSNPDIPSRFTEFTLSTVLTIDDESARTAGLDVYLLDADQPVGSSTTGSGVALVRDRIGLLDGNEHVNVTQTAIGPPRDDGPAPTVADTIVRDATTSTEGRIRFNAAGTEGCLLVVPPEDSELNVRSACVSGSPPQANVSVRLDDDTDWGAVTGDEWPQFQRTPANTGTAADEEPPRSDVRTAWTAEISGDSVTSPVVAGDTVFVAGGAGDLHAFAQGDGTRTWTFDGDGETNAGPAATDGTVFYAAGGVVYALDAETGLVEWQTDVAGDGGLLGATPSQTRSSVTVADGRVFATVGDSTRNVAVVVLDASSGRLLNEVQNLFLVTGTPAYDDRTGRAVVAGRQPAEEQDAPVIAARNVVVVDNETGTVDERFTVPATVKSGATVAGDSVVVPTMAATLHRFRLDDLSAADGLLPILANHPNLLSSNIQTSPAYDGERFYFGTGGPDGFDMARALFSSQGRQIAAVDADTGGITAQRGGWRTDGDGDLFVSGVIVSSPAVANGTVYAGESRLTGGAVIAADADTGELLWQYETDSRIQAAPAIDDGRVYVTGDDGTVYALAGSTAGGAVTTSASLADGTAEEVAVTGPDSDAVAITDASLDGVPEPPGRAVDTVDIEAPDPDGSNATVAFVYPPSAVEDARSLTVYHYDTDAGRWEVLPTRVSVTGDRITAEAETDEFSPFAVTTARAGGDDGVDTVAASDSLADVAPARTAESLVVDGRATFAGAGVVRAVRLDEDVSGSVDVREIDTPPAAVTAAVISDRGDAVRVRTVVDVTASRPAVERAGGTIELRVDSRGVDPDDLTIVRETDDGWTRVDTRVLAADDGTVTLAGDIEAFSPLAVATVTNATTPTPTSTSTPTPAETATPGPEPTETPSAVPTSPPASPSQPTSTDLPGFGLLAGLLGLLLFAGLRAGRRR